MLLIIKPQNRYKLTRNYQPLPQQIQILITNLIPFHQFFGKTIPYFMPKGVIDISFIMIRISIQVLLRLMDNNYYILIFFQ